jgi:hypothetical protein
MVIAATLFTHLLMKRSTRNTRVEMYILSVVSRICTAYVPCLCAACHTLLLTHDALCPTALCLRVACAYCAASQSYLVRPFLLSALCHLLSGSAVCPLLHALRSLLSALCFQLSALCSLLSGFCCLPSPVTLMSFLFTLYSALSLVGSLQSLLVPLVG